MNVDIRDAEAVRAIQPVDAALYLRANGWSIAQQQATQAAVWEKQARGESFEALLPMNAAVRDYALRMGELLAVLSVEEQRSQTEVYRDVLTSTSDVIRIRIADPELNDGTLPIEEHAQIAQKARDLVLAAACAATERRAVWHKRKPGQAMEHVRRVRIGQSERGSYVVTVLSRVAPLLHGQNDQLFEADPPYERRVTEILATSLQALEQAAGRAAVTQQMSAFDEAVSQGVNANLCDAVAGLWGGDELQRHLEFSFTWAPSRPVSPEIVRRVSIASDRVPVIREAGRQMRERAPSPDFELTGPVVRLNREADAPTGKATVVGIVDERQVRVSVDLADAEYHKAILAHDQGKSLQLLGTLVREGRGYLLRAPSNVEILEE
jgi:hypothetical protein